jgi:hypothetical protein
LDLLAKDEANWVFEGREDGGVEGAEHFGGELGACQEGRQLGPGTKAREKEVRRKYGANVIEICGGEGEVSRDEVNGGWRDGLQSSRVWTAWEDFGHAWPANLGARAIVGRASWGSG